MDLVIIVIINFWIVFSLLPLIFHNSPLLKTIIRLDPLFLLPHWRMYVKDNPGLEKFDYFIRYRDINENGSTTDWRLLEQVEKRWYHIIWHPAFTRKILVYHYTQFLLGNLSQSIITDSDLRELYGLVLNAVLKCPRLEDQSVKREFELVCYDMLAKKKNNALSLHSRIYAI